MHGHFGDRGYDDALARHAMDRYATDTNEPMLRNTVPHKPINNNKLFAGYMRTLSFIYK